MSHPTTETVERLGFKIPFDFDRDTNFVPVFCNILQTGSKLASDFHFHLLSKIGISVLGACAPVSTPVGNAIKLNEQTCCFLGVLWMEAKNQKAYYVGKLILLGFCPSHYAQKATSLFGSIAFPYHTYDGAEM